MRPMNDHADTPQPVTERWAFAGQRLTAKGPLANIWVDNAGNGEELWFPGKGKHIIGTLYDVNVTRHGERLTRHGDPKYTGTRLPHDDDRVRRWAVHDNAAHVQHQQRRAEANAAKRDAIDQALEPLVKIASTCRTRTERDALLATVIRRLTAHW